MIKKFIALPTVLLSISLASCGGSAAAKDPYAGLTKPDDISWTKQNLEESIKTFSKYLDVDGEQEYLNSTPNTKKYGNYGSRVFTRESDAWWNDAPKTITLQSYFQYTEMITSDGREVIMYNIRYLTVMVDKLISGNLTDSIWSGIDSKRFVKGDYLKSTEEWAIEDEGGVFGPTMYKSDCSEDFINNANTYSFAKWEHNITNKLCNSN